MGEANVTAVVSHWYQLFDGFNIQPTDFYDSLEQAIAKRKIPDARCVRVECAEGGILSSKRLYLRVVRKEYYFDICAAPFGRGFFVSWWLVAPRGCLAMFEELPYIGAIVRTFFNPLTYYKIDTALMFQQAVHGALLGLLDRILESRGVRAMTESERKPIMRDFFQR